MTVKKVAAAAARRLQRALDSVHYAHLLGIELEEVVDGTASLFFQVRKELTQNQGLVHGGAIASLIDTAMAFAIISNLPPEDKVTTVDLTISFLRPLTAGRVVAKAKVLRSGRRLITVSADVFSEDGRLAATALSTYTKL